MSLPSLEASGRPVYLQIADHLREEIEEGVRSSGSRLPTIRALASELRVNRDTVALAYESLASQGLLESTVGRGTFVRSPGASEVHAVEPAFAQPVERLLGFENARPRVGQSEGAVPLHSLIPDPSLYPVDAFRRCLNRVLAAGGGELFLYGGPQGHPGLREQLAIRLHAQGVDCSADDVVLCHGASQGISLAIRLFAGSGECIAVETPTYHNVLATLLSFGIEAVAVPMRPGGPDLEGVDRVLARPEVKAFYTIPTFHNPMGTTTGVAHRRALLSIAAAHRKPIVEDAFEMDLRFRGRRVPSLAALDTSGLVVQLSSFSKSLFPGVRIGALLARGRSVEGVIALKHATDLSDSLPLQAALEAFVAEGSYDRHLGKLRRELKLRCEALLDALAESMPQGTQITQPEGGYQVWLELPFEVDTRELVVDAARAGVLFAPGSQFLPDAAPSRCLRLTIAQAGVDEIRRGVAALAEVVERRRGARAPRRDTAGVNL